MTPDLFIEALNSSERHPSKLVRVARAMRSSDRWARGAAFERGNRLALPDNLAPISGEFEAR